MNRKRQRRKQLQGNPGGRSIKRSILAWMLCATLAFGGICVPETRMSVQAAEPMEISEEEFSEEVSSSWDATDVSGGDSGSGNTVAAMSLASAEDEIVKGTYENIKWLIDEDGELIVMGTGEFQLQREVKERLGMIIGRILRLRKFL